MTTLACGLGLLSSFSFAPLHAADIRGQVRIGGYTRQVEFKEPIAGETNNDEMVISSQFRLELLDMNESSDQILLDFRDKYDNFGKLERQNLRLKSYNRMQIRTFAYQRPWEVNRFYFTLGRFSLPEANLLSHDGGDVGYRFSKSSRLGLFAGLGPKDILLPLYVDPQEKSVSNTQVGSYYTYENKSGVEDSSYLTLALAQAPSYDITDKASHSYLFQQGMWTFTSAHRLASHVLFDFQPSSTMRKASVSHIFTSEKFRTNTYLQQTKTEDYLLAQTLEARLKPSAVQTLGFDLRHRLGNIFSMDYALDYGKRTLDGKSQSGFALGFLVPRLLHEATSARTQFGLRNNFESKDTYIKVGLDYWGRLFSLSLSHMISNEDYEAGEKNKRQISSIDSGWFFTEELRGSIGYQREQDSKASASAFLLMVGYRFGQASVSPLRSKPPRFESM